MARFQELDIIIRDEPGTLERSPTPTKLYTKRAMMGNLVSGPARMGRNANQRSRLCHSMNRLAGGAV
jgi:hypothetical protein